jgi:hypothetical protein
MNAIQCPVCGKEVEPLQYAHGWSIGICCGRVIYNSTNPLQQTTDKKDKSGGVKQEEIEL